MVPSACRLALATSYLVSSSAPPALSSFFYCVVVCLCCCPVCSVCSGAKRKFNQNFNLLIFSLGGTYLLMGWVFLRYRYRLINYSDQCMFIIVFLLILLLNFEFYCNLNVVWGFLPLMFCLIRADLCPVGSAVWDPELELYRINVYFYS